MAENDKGFEIPEKVRGEAKEKVGEVINDDELERQGRLDKAKADLKDAAEDAKSGIADAAEKVKSGTEDAVDKAKKAFQE